MYGIISLYIIIKELVDVDQSLHTRRTECFVESCELNFSEGIESLIQIVLKTNNAEEYDEELYHS